MIYKLINQHLIYESFRRSFNGSESILNNVPPKQTELLLGSWLGLLPEASIHICHVLRSYVCIIVVRINKANLCLSLITCLIVEW